MTAKARAGLALGVLVVVAAGAAAFAQGFGRSRRQGPQYEVQGNTPYDGRFVFVRVRYDEGMGSYGGGFRRGGGPHWSHDYPDGELHFTRILDELTFLRPRTDGSNILSLDDPELFNYPVAYMCEPGFWVPNDAQVAIVSLNGSVYSVIGPGSRVLVWKALLSVSIELINVYESPEVDKNRTLAFKKLGLSSFTLMASVEEDQAGLLYLDNRLEKVLLAGEGTSLAEAARRLGITYGRAKYAWATYAPRSAM